ncbi:hypothetical protein L1887_19332 [Cichorium endivia]|nr:hypothetical protein L1887_19332 [Cichorium endivia]
MKSAASLYPWLSILPLLPPGFTIATVTMSLKTLKLQSQTTVVGKEKSKALKQLRIEATTRAQNRLLLSLKSEVEKTLEVSAIGQD